ncbi:hypothetical protein R83H12_02176 [Fibrobacteria bacterium R8-3-H12]
MSVQKFKKGFTLIELMVVIVIIGILAAIAIPKLFGMSAKAKASELAPAGGTWIKLQQAYSLESGKYGEDFTKIAYTAPNSKVFSYAAGSASSAAKAEWEASSKEKLNECPKAATWKLEMKKSSTSGSVPDNDNITASYPSSNSSECEAITPAFGNLGNTSEESSSSEGG